MRLRPRCTIAGLKSGALPGYGIAAKPALSTGLLDELHD
jgi:hypothetical protein